MHCVFIISSFRHLVSEGLTLQFYCFQRTKAIILFSVFIYCMAFVLWGFFSFLLLKLLNCTAMLKIQKLWVM